MNLRKTFVIKQAKESDETNESCSPITRVAAFAVVKNLFAGRFVEYLSPLLGLGRDVCELLEKPSVAVKP